jgi:hypothetical protein
MRSRILLFLICGLFVLGLASNVMAMALPAPVPMPVMVFAFSVTALSVKLAVVIPAVYAVLQVLKKIFPSIGGWGAVALNLGLTVVGILVTTPPDQYFTGATLAAIVTAALGAAGFHGTVKSAVLGT